MGSTKRDSITTQDKRDEPERVRTCELKDINRRVRFNATQDNWIRQLNSRGGPLTPATASTINQPVELENSENKSVYSRGWRGIAIYDVHHPKFNTRNLPIIDRSQLTRNFFK